MDGNGRWAKQRGIPTIEGHRMGALAARGVVEAASQIGIEYVTLYAFSSENWKRPLEWIQSFLSLFKWYLKSWLEDLIKHGVRLRFIGDLSKFDDRFQSLLQDTEEKTKMCTQIGVQIALGYGGQDEIIRAAQKASVQAQKNNTAITHDSFIHCLDTYPLPNPDLLIRTSGEKRISNFLLFQMAYTEFVFLDTLWPDFKQSDLEGAISEFTNRKRTFGS